jgi:hypothetical protein
MVACLFLCERWVDRRARKMVSTRRYTVEKRKTNENKHFKFWNLWVAFLSLNTLSVRYRWSRAIKIRKVSNLSLTIKFVSCDKIDLVRYRTRWDETDFIVHVNRPLVTSQFWCFQFFYFDISSFGISDLAKTTSRRGSSRKLISARRWPIPFARCRLLNLGYLKFGLKHVLTM